MAKEIKFNIKLNMKEKIKRVCKNVYDGYQKWVATVGADRLVHLFLSVCATVVGAMILLRVLVCLPVWVAALISALVALALGVRLGLWCV